MPESQEQSPAYTNGHVTPSAYDQRRLALEEGTRDNIASILALASMQFADSLNYEVFENNIRFFKDVKTHYPGIYNGYFAAEASLLRGFNFAAFDRRVDLLPNAAPHGWSPGLGMARSIMPSLPRDACLDAGMAHGAAPWLEDYIQHSKKWSPSAAQSFHQAIGLWILSTVAARRVCVHLGSEKFPTLCLALIAPSTLYAKTTTAKIGRTAVHRSGCACLLAPHRSTPQALVQFMGGPVPADYGDVDDLKRIEYDRRLAFAGQCGWYYEEWGGMLHQMTRRDSPVAEFHALLKMLDDSDESYSSNTIMRGLEKVDRPYLSLLASATPADLCQFMKPSSPWWHDGFWPRFAFITPLPNECPIITPLQRGLAFHDDRHAAKLITDLYEWHNWLGIPSVEVKERDGAKGKNARWQVNRTSMEPHILSIDDAVHEAMHNYRHALLTMHMNKEIHEDLGSCYGRLHEKALRIAMLLASFSRQSIITLAHWTYAQHITEDWRLMLHHVIAMAEQAQPQTKEEILEDKITNLLAQYEMLSRRQLQRHLHHTSSRELASVLKAMLGALRIKEVEHGNTVMYMLCTDMPLHEGDIKDEEIML